MPIVQALDADGELLDIAVTDDPGPLTVTCPAATRTIAIEHGEGRSFTFRMHDEWVEYCD